MKFRFTLSEFSGALADLGVMLPLVLALISLNGLNATAAFVGIGIAYAITAVVYRLSVPVQPLKSVSAIALALGLSPVIIVAGAIWNAIAFLGLGLTGADKWVRKAFPKPVVRGIQIGLAYLLVKSAWKIFQAPSSPWVSGMQIFSIPITWWQMLIIGSTIMLGDMLVVRPDWAALCVIVFGVAIAGLTIGFPQVQLKLTLPNLFQTIPTLDQLLMGLWLLALPQIPLSLGNSIYATADAAHQYFEGHAATVTERRLMLTMGVNDAIAAVLGGMPVCHGSGGMTAHYQMGARTGGAPLMLGVIFLAIGLFAGPASMEILQLIPLPVLAVLLIYIGWKHVLLARDLRGAHQVATAGLVVMVAVLTSNLGVGFLCGAVFYYLWLATGRIVRPLRVREVLRAD